MLFFGPILLRLVVIFTVPRVLNRALTPDTVYPLYGLHYTLHRTIARLTNSKFLTALFGDSSFIVPYLRGLGWKLPRWSRPGRTSARRSSTTTPT